MPLLAISGPRVRDFGAPGGLWCLPGGCWRPKVSYPSAVLGFLVSPGGQKSRTLVVAAPPGGQKSRTLVPFLAPGGQKSRTLALPEAPEGQKSRTLVPARLPAAKSLVP